jgi:hypothetical protein
MRPLRLSLTLLLGLLGSAAHAQEPVPGQPYAIPQGYEGYSPGSMIAYGRYNYVIQGNATMLLADAEDGSGTDDGTTPADSVPVDTTAYQTPPGYENAQPGSQISYCGNDYTVMSGGTMMMCNPGYFLADNMQYQIPPDYVGAGAGSIVSYGGFNYLIGAGVMIKIHINAGYGTKPIPGKKGVSLTSLKTNGSKTDPVNNGHPGTAVPNKWVVQRPVYPGTPGPVHSTTARPGLINPGAVHPGWGNPGLINPGAVHPGWGNPGLINPGAVHPGWVNPGVGHPGSVHPGWGNPRVGHPGPVHPGWGNQPVVHPGGGRPMIGGGRVGRR